MSGTTISSPKKDEHQLILQIQSDKVVGQLMKALPKGLSAQGFVRQAVTLVRRTPDLVKCDALTVLGGIIQAAELGMQLSNALGHCFLIPRWNSRRKTLEAVFQMGYKGWRELANRSGRVLSIQPRIISQGDDWQVEYGTRPHVDHSPCSVPGDAIAYYCTAHLVNTSVVDFEYMSRQRVQQWRERYSPAPRDKTDYSAWATNFDAMALKTVTGLLCRRLPLSIEFQQFLAVADPAPQEPVQFLPRTQELLAELGMPAETGDDGGPDAEQGDAQAAGPGGRVAELPTQGKKAEA